MSTVEPPNGLDTLTFVRSAPVKPRGSTALSPLEKARKKFVVDIDLQISVARNPSYAVTKTVKKRDGTTEELIRKPRSWVVRDDDGMSYITPRFSNNVLNVGGKKGTVIRCVNTDVVKVLNTVKAWAVTAEADSVLEKALQGTKRRKRQK